MVRERLRDGERERKTKIWRGEGDVARERETKRWRGRESD